MSLSTHDLNRQYTVAILGGTGSIGRFVSRILLTEYGAHFVNVRVATRDPSAEKHRHLTELGAVLYPFDHPVDDLLSGVDVVVNALPPRIILQNHKEFLEALARHNVKVYFMSEYGLDYRLHEFDGYEHSEWVNKRIITAETRNTLPGNIKVIALLVGTFLGWFLRPDLGYDIEKNVYAPLGPPTCLFRGATTAESDIGRSIAQLALLALNPTTAATVPDDIRIFGQNPSYEDVRDAVSRVKGVPKGEVKPEDLSEFNDNLREHPSENIFDYIRVAIGQGKVDFSSNNENELVNPGQKLWRWKTVEDQLCGQA